MRTKLINCAGRELQQALEHEARMVEKKEVLTWPYLVTFGISGQGT